MTNKKIKIGTGVRRTDNWITAALCLTEAEPYTFEFNKKKYIRVNINIYDKPNQYGKDVAITLDTYKSDKVNDNKDVQEEAKTLPF